MNLRRKNKKWIKPYYRLMPYKVIQRETYSVTYMCERTHRTFGSVLLRYTPNKGMKVFLMSNDAEENGKQYIVIDSTYEEAEEVFFNLISKKPDKYVELDEPNVEWFRNRPFSYVMLGRGGFYK